MQAYGADKTAAIAESHLVEPPLDITVKSDPEMWTERLGAKRLPTGSLRRTSGGDIRNLPGFAQGAWWVQDAAAALPARLLGDVSGQTVFDLCAAPGGKTAQLAAAGANVVAIDSDAARLELVDENLKRLGLHAQLDAADATQWLPTQPADAILIDAPCSATGTIRRRPDIARLRTPDDVARLAKLQDDPVAYDDANLAMTRNTRLGNIMETCGVTIPCQANDQLPVGLSFMALSNREGMVLRLGRAAEKAFS